MAVLFSYKDQLSKHPNLFLTRRYRGAANIQPSMVAKEVGEAVVSAMRDGCGIEVAAEYGLIETGGLLSKKEQAGVKFTFPGTDYAWFLVGFNKIAAVVEINGIGLGAVSKGMQRTRLADQSDGFSLSGMIRKAVTGLTTDSGKVEEEQMYYDSLRQCVDETIDELLGGE